MKKWSRPLFTLVLAAFLTCFIAPLIHASEASDYVDFYTAYNDYLVALNDKSKGPADVQSALSKVIEKAEKYLSKYEDKVAQNTNSVLGKLISLYYGSGKKDWDKVILYSEKLVQKSTLTDNDKIGVYLVLSDAYVSSAKDMNKGAEYAENAKKLTANKLKISRRVVRFFFDGITTCYLFRVCVIVSMLSARLPKTPFTKRAELSVPKAFANSTASLIPTFRGVFRYTATSHKASLKMLRSMTATWSKGHSGACSAISESSFSANSRTPAVSMRANSYWVSSKPIAPALSATTSPSK